MANTTVKCTSDRYAASADEFASVEEFLQMCDEVLGERPELTEQADGWHDDQGLVLERGAAYRIVASGDGVVGGGQAEVLGDAYGRTYHSLEEAERYCEHLTDEADDSDDQCHGIEYSVVGA